MSTELPRLRPVVALAMAFAAVAALVVPSAVVSPDPAPAEVAVPTGEALGASQGVWPPGLAEAARQAVEADRYAANFDTAGTLVAPNPAQGFATRFEASGPALAPAEGGPWALSLSLVAAGHGEALAPVAAPVQVAASDDGQEVRYARGPLTEWYRNAPGGLEQGFTLAEPLPGSGSVPLEVQMEVAGSLSPTIQNGDIALAGPNLDPRLLGVTVRSWR